MTFWPSARSVAVCHVQPRRRHTDTGCFNCCGLERLRSHRCPRWPQAPLSTVRARAPVVANATAENVRWDMYTPLG